MGHANRLADGMGRRIGAIGQKDTGSADHAAPHHTGNLQLSRVTLNERMSAYVHNQQVA
jgi:hypothetical protein